MQQLRVVLLPRDGGAVLRLLAERQGRCRRRGLGVCEGALILVGESEVVMDLVVRVFARRSVGYEHACLAGRRIRGCVS